MTLPRLCCTWILLVGWLSFPNLAISEEDDSWIRRLLEHAPRKGICLLVTPSDPTFPVRAAKATKLTIYTQFPDPAKAREARLAAERAGLLGSRVFISEGDLSKLHLANDLVDAAYVRGGARGSKKRQSEIMRVLRPGGKWKILYRGTITKPFSNSTDEWSHPYHGPDNNPQSEDKVARGPFLTHFMAEPWYAAMPQISVISGGRIFKVWGNRSSKQPSWKSLNTLICINAFNGTTLWRKKIKPGFLRHRNTIIATPDTLYFADDVSCKLIDPRTGKTRDEIVIPKKISDEPVWCWMGLEDGVLYALVGKKEPKVEVARWRKNFRGAGWPWWRYEKYDFGYGRTIVAIDPKTKKILWHHKENELLDMRAMCMRKGRIYFYSNQKFVGCLNAKSGKLLWKESDPKALQAIGDLTPAQNPYYGFITTAYVKCNDDGLYFAGPMCKNIVAVSAKNGKYMWDIKDAGNSLLVLRKEAVYALGGGRLNNPLQKETPPSLKLHPITGKVLAKFKSRDRCTRATGCVDAIFTRGGRGGSTSVFDLTSTEPRMGIISPMRPACQDGVTIAHGYFFWGPWMCRCDSTQIGIISLGPAGEFLYGQKATAANLEKTNEKLELAKFPVDNLDWPTFRKDNSRSARTSVRVPEKVTQLWSYEPNGRPIATAPVTAGDAVLVGGSDGVIRSLDAKTGKLRWKSFTSGDTKYPPAIADNRVYVGSGDGYVYCFEATKGQRLWRFRAAPMERRIPIFGSLISTWPVGGGVIVDKGTVYAAAGNANFNGTHVYALDAITGKIKWQNNESGEGVDRPNSGAGVQGHLLLHKNHLWMQGGNLTGLVSYDTENGNFNRQGKFRGRYGNLSGRDLYVLNDRVEVSGLPLYFRQEDSHFIERVGISTPEGVVAVYTVNPNSETPTVLVALADAKSNPQRPKAIWKTQPFTENNAVAVSTNAVIVAGVNRQGVWPDIKTTSGLCAFDLTSGKQLWRHNLPAEPSGWGVAINRDGKVIVSLQDGRVICFGKKG
ncbi:MAG: PQQ-binding-like beta-propeller repeat protein [Gemmataceae bacterium]